jgi:ATP-dependent DNA helicase RecG
MASSLQTLTKILDLEKKKGYQNTAVIGGFARFAYHWEQEAHSQAQTEEHHQLVDCIATQLRAYDDLSIEERPNAIEEILALATGQASPTSHQQESEAPPTPTSHAAPSSHSPKSPPITASDDTPRTVRERRGYSRQQPQEITKADLRGLAASVETLEGVGPRRQEQLQRLGVTTINDLLYLLPRLYVDYSQLKLIRDLEAGETVTIVGTIRKSKLKTTKSGKSLMEVVISDGSASLRLAWFNQPWLEKPLRPGRPIIVSGTVDQYLGRLMMNSPDWEAVEREHLNTGRIVPVYPLTSGMTERMMRQLTKQAVEHWSHCVPDPLPLSIREGADLMDLPDALQQAHFPDSHQSKDDALRRLAFDEFLLMHLTLLQQRRDWQGVPAMPLSVGDGWVKAFENALPFRLTSAQQRALSEIRADMASEVPMNRLLQGDVGSGKTIVAAIAIGTAIENGAQAALMAPTSILAEQHFISLQELLTASPMGDWAQVALLTGAISGVEREQIYAGLADGTIHLVVGTHALIQESVTFANLGLAIIDEQHRFGVTQRATLRNKVTNGNPHLLVMTATPIPRTLALTIHADLDLSILDEMPPGRQPVETRILQPKERERAYAFIRSQVEQGRQAYMVYPLIEESEKLDARAATTDFERLCNEVFPDLRLAILHGRLSPDDKEAVMANFAWGEIDILVSTSVIEVGVDIPNATVMMVESAARFGLAQLHQLRGRVGRGVHKSYCLLLSEPTPLRMTNERLSALESTTDGFALAELDWEMRGAGELLGTQQSGFIATLRFADLMDIHLVEIVQRMARQLVQGDPDLSRPEHHLLAERIAWTLDSTDIS